MAEGIIEPDQFADWEALIVPILNQDKVSVRICGDLKLTNKPTYKLDRYPIIPRIEDILAKLADGKQFTQLDLSQTHK